MTLPFRSVRASRVLAVICSVAAAAALRAAAVQSPIATEQEARAICSACHVYPAPEILPRGAWADSIARMTLFRMGQPEPAVTRGTLASVVPLPDDMARVLAFYESRAPARLPVPEPWPLPDRRSPHFVKSALAPKHYPPVPGISNVQFLDLAGAGTIEVVATDMRHGLVLHANPADPAGVLEVLADVPYPARSELVDVDGDGLKDLLIADLGQFLPGDAERGAAVWLRRTPDGKYITHTFGGLPRVADVRAADFDGDGRRDLLVAAFGWRKVGHIALLRNRSTDYSHPSFEASRLDSRTGTITVPPLDLNGDGRMDFIALISQQHEQVVAFINRPEGFKPEIIYAAPHPNWGSSGMDVADLDGDGDMDVLMAHGDSLDDGILKPYHGIEWLENRGSYPFVAHTLATLPGVHPVKAVDLDGDGDLDIVASSFLPLADPREAAKLPSIVWLEQTSRGHFERHTLEVGRPYHASLDAADFDRDGDIDLAVGNLSPKQEVPAWIEIWKNQRVSNRTR